MSLSIAPIDTNKSPSTVHLTLPNAMFCSPLSPNRSRNRPSFIPSASPCTHATVICLASFAVFDQPPPPQQAGLDGTIDRSKERPNTPRVLWTKKRALRLVRWLPSQATSRPPWSCCLQGFAPPTCPYPALRCYTRLPSRYSPDVTFLQGGSPRAPLFDGWKSAAPKQLPIHPRHPSRCYRLAPPAWLKRTQPSMQNSQPQGLNRHTVR